MSFPQRAAAVVVELALLVTICGLVRRRRLLRSVFFTAYLPAVFVGNFLMIWWPQRFYVPAFWMAEEAVYDVLKLGIAMELGWRTFRAFPRAQSIARRSAFLVLAVTAALVMAVPVDVQGVGVYATVVTELHPRILNGTVWLIACTLAVAQWYRVPVHPFHAGVLTGFTLYVGFYSTLLSLAALYGFSAVKPWGDALEPPAYLLLTGWWAHLAWRAESTAAISQATVVRRLELWTASCG